MALDDFAILVGINTYPHLRCLRGPENDALAFHEWLTSPLGGAVPNKKPNVQLILSSCYAAATTPSAAHPWKDDIYSAFNLLRDIGNGNGGRTGRRLYMFFAGHGISPENEVDEAALLMANAAKDSLSHIPGRGVAQYFRASAYFDEVVLFMDCCREAWGSTRVQRPDWEIKNCGKPVQRFFGFAAPWNHDARETENEIMPGRKAVHGVFTAHLLAILRGGRMSATTLRRTMLSSKAAFRMGKPYEPEFDPQEQDAITFNESQAAAQYELKVALKSLASGDEFEIRDGRFQSVHLSKPSAPIFSLSLSPGPYEARIRGSNRELIFDVPGRTDISL